MDYGISGLKKTISLLQDRSIGAGNYVEAYTPKIVSKDGITVSFLSLTHKEFGCVEQSPNSLGTAWILNPELPLIISNIKRRVDFLIILAHAGIEYIDIPLPEWRSTYKSFINWGADCVIATHPHVPQGKEIYKGKYIYYSLGNFCFQNEAIEFECNNKPYWDNSLMVSIKIDSHKRLNVITYCLHYSQNDGSIMLDDNDNIVKHIRYCNELLTNEVLYNEQLNRYCNLLVNTYRSMLEASGWMKFNFSISTIKFLIRFLRRKKSDRVHLLNALQCESHRWLINRMLKNELL